MATDVPRDCEDANLEVEKFINELGPKRYSHEDLETFTSNFSESNILGSGAYGMVYKGQLPNGVQVAVKRLINKDVVEDFLAEVSTISTANHRNLVQLKGYCFEPNLRALVYEYMESGSLDKILYKRGSRIEWEKIYGIAIEIAKGLDYLHDGSHGQIIHYDIKAGNVLLNKNLCPKITDFGMAKLVERNISHLPLTRTRGTPGYNAPETWMPGSQVTYKCDVYSFGMMLFEILGNKNNGEGENWFPRQVWEKFDKGQLEHELNHIGIEEVNIENAKLSSMVALWCVQFKPENRPTMREVVSMLEKTIHVKRPPNPFPVWQFLKSSVLLSPEGISEDSFKSSYGTDGRSIQDAESFLFSLEGNIPGSTDIVSAESESQVTFQPRTVEEGVEANVTLSAFSVGVVNPDGGLDIFANVQKMPEKINYSNGDSYEGTLENSLRHGQGKFVSANGDTYIGEWKNDELQGYGKLTCKNGNCYEGALKNSEKDGQGRYVWANGDEYIGEWKNNVQEGHGKFNYKDGACYEGTFRNSKMDGHGRYVWASGSTYNGEWKNNVQEGEGEFVWANGDTYDGEWKNDVREGKGRIIWATGDEYSGEWKNNVRDGNGKLTCKNGDIWEGTFENDNKVKGRFTNRKSRLLRLVDRLI